MRGGGGFLQMAYSSAGGKAVIPVSYLVRLSWQTGGSGKPLRAALRDVCPVILDARRRRGRPRVPAGENGGEPLIGRA